MKLDSKQSMLYAGVMLLAALAISCAGNGVSKNQEDDDSESAYKKLKESCFTVNSAGDTITTYKRDDAGCFYKDIAIPEVIKGTTITSIGNHAFKANPEQQKLTGVLIPKTVTKIGDSAFESNELTKLRIPDNVEAIGIRAFAFNHIADLTISNHVTIIKNLAFANNKLSTITLPKGVTTINYGVFRKNQLKTLTIPNTVREIGATAFVKNPDLTRIVIHPHAHLSVDSSAFPHGFVNAFNVQIPKKSGAWEWTGATWIAP